MATRVSAINSTNAFWNDYDLQKLEKNHINSTSHGVFNVPADLLVAESDIPANTVKIGLGSAYININKNSVDYTVEFNNSSDFEVSIGANVSGNSRIDLVIARIDTVTDPDVSSSNVGLLEVIEGTPAGSPVTPSLPANSIPLALISVANGQTTFLDADITDARQEFYYVNMRGAGGGSGKDFATIEDVQIDASSSVQGTTKLSIDPVTATEPIAVGDNDTRMLTNEEKTLALGAAESSPVITIPFGSLTSNTPYDWGGNYGNFNTGWSPTTLLGLSPNGGASATTGNYDKLDLLGIGAYASGSNHMYAGVGIQTGSKGSRTESIKAVAYFGQGTNSSGSSTNASPNSWIYDYTDTTWVSTASVSGVSQSTVGTWRKVILNTTDSARYIGEDGVIAFAVSTTSTSYLTAVIDYAEATTLSGGGTLTSPAYCYMDQGNAVIFDAEINTPEQQANGLGFIQPTTVNGALDLSGFDTGDTNEYYSKATIDDYVSLLSTPATIIAASANTDEPNLSAIDNLYAVRSASNNLEYSYQLLEFDTSTRTKADLFRLSFGYTGSAGGANLTDGVNLYAWNETDTQWDAMGSTTVEVGTDDSIDKDIFGTDVQKYINGSDKVYLLARSLGTSDGVDTMSLNADYAHLTCHESVVIQTAGKMGGFTNLKPGYNHRPAKTGNYSSLGPDYGSKVGPMGVGGTSTNISYHYVTEITPSGFDGYIDSITVDQSRSGSPGGNTYFSIIKSETTPTGNNSSSYRFGEQIISNSFTQATDTERTIDIKTHLTGRYWVYVRTDILFGAGNNQAIYSDATGTTYRWQRSSSSYGWSTSNLHIWFRLNGLKLSTDKVSTDLAISAVNLAHKPVGLALSDTELLVGDPRYGQYQSSAIGLGGGSTSWYQGYITSVFVPTPFTPYRTRELTKSDSSSTDYWYTGGLNNLDLRYQLSSGNDVIGIATSYGGMISVVTPDGIFYTSTNTGGANTIQPTIYSI
jgi:hypothetical protein